jgi:DNA gyrase/topoisomerase IV subunit B
MATKKPASRKTKTEAVEIDALDPYQQSRIRTEMWLGSRDPHSQTILSYGSSLAPVEMTWVPALFTSIREVMDNAVDELVTHGHGDRLEINYNPKTMTFKVSDNGRGIPISIHPKEGIPQATLALSRAFAGRNFNDEERGASRGVNGVGASVVNFCSEWFKLDITRDGKNFHQTFSEGETALQIEEPVILPASPKTPTGTTISFRLSKKVFNHFTLPEEFIRDRVYEIALCYPKLKVFYNGKQVKSLGPEKSLFKDKKPISFEINDKGFRSRFWLLPEFLETSGEHAHGLVNAIPVFNGGTHIDTFRRMFYSGMIKALERESKKRRLTPNRSDFADGMLIFNITEMDAPAFDSQSKTRLINEHTGKIVSTALDDVDFFKNVVKKNSDWINSVYERCAARTQKKDDKDMAALAKKARKQKVEKLTDATGADRSKCVLLLAEGDSAISGSMSMRDPKVHGGLPLRGKVLNVHPTKISMRDAVKNEALQQIIASIGLVPGQRANRHMLRYGKVYITCDADEDGKNIAALLVNFFYQWWPELFADESKPFLYVFETPLIIATKGKQTKYWYNDDYDSFDSDDYKGWEVTRAKGLAALKKPDWQRLLAEPKLTPITDDGELKECLDLLFSDVRADDRKEWIGK